MNWPLQWKVLWLCYMAFLPNTILSQEYCSLPNNLSEERFFIYIEKLVSDKLYSTARDYLDCVSKTDSDENFRFKAKKIQVEVLSKMEGNYLTQRFELYQELLKIKPDHPDADQFRFESGKIQFLQGRYQYVEEALISISKGSKLFGISRNLIGRALFQRMIDYQQRNLVMQARELSTKLISYHQAAIENKIPSEEARISNYELGYTFYRNKQFKEALPFWENFLELAESSKKTEDVRYSVANIHHRQKNWLQAEQRYGEYANSGFNVPEEERAEATFWWGETAFQLEAEKLEKNLNNEFLAPEFVRKILPRYEKYLATNYDDHRALSFYRLGQLYQSIDQPQQAVAAYQQYLKTENEAFRQEANFELGMLYARQNEPKKALEQLLPFRNQEQYLKEQNFWTMLVQQYDALGNKTKAEQILRDAYNNDSF